MSPFIFVSLFIAVLYAAFSYSSGLGIFLLFLILALCAQSGSE